jgi:hypothetical protein
MFMVVSFPWPAPSAYAQLARHAAAISRTAGHDAQRGDTAQPELVGAGQAR